MEGWKEQFLPQAGNEVLIKSVIQAIPSYIMAIVRLPKKFCQSLRSAVANYWWSSKVRNRGMHWKIRDTMCGSKNKGGLGFKEFASQNSTLLSKQAWRFLQNPNDYWALMLRGIYYERDCFWKVKANAGISWAWRSLLHGRELLKTSGRWSIGSGAVLIFQRTIGLLLVEKQWLSKVVCWLLCKN